MSLGSTDFTLTLSYFLCVGRSLEALATDPDFRYFALCDKCGGTSCRICEDVGAHQLADEKKMENSHF